MRCCTPPRSSSGSACSATPQPRPACARASGSDPSGPSRRLQRRSLPRSRLTSMPLLRPTLQRLPRPPAPPPPPPHRPAGRRDAAVLTAPLIGLAVLAAPAHAALPTGFRDVTVLRGLT